MTAELDNISSRFVEFPWPRMGRFRCGGFSSGGSLFHPSLTVRFRIWISGIPRGSFGFCAFRCT